VDVSVRHRRPSRQQRPSRHRGGIASASVRDLGVVNVIKLFYSSLTKIFFLSSQTFFYSLLKLILCC